MKDYIKEIIKKGESSDYQRNLVREYLQEYFLYILYRKKFFKDIVFCGGTSLRFIYKIKRFSEDLDFSLSQQSGKIDFQDILKIQKDEFEKAGFKAEVKISMKTNVNNAFFDFPGLLFEYGLSPHKQEKTSIKIEIDTNPPKGGKEEMSTYNGSFMFYLMHYDIASLFAGKMHALLARKYTKGRDWYDLVWYLSKFKDITPNFEMLNNALKQTGNDSIAVNGENWKQILLGLAKDLDEKSIVSDVYRFLEDPGEKELLTKENIINTIGT
ncbi:MAG: nucleotidyl transferase AbiEii/AbiGii toxin family protein [Endomicrobiales bacterium]|nr:nucleotidyl transferase AbiEii/AbiGii toxin family protein [Endomicrobiales bacterium]